MDPNMPSNVIQSSTDYDQFHFLTANRDKFRGHVERLKKAFAEYGNLTPTQPILVNENYEIIDGQHRFVACKELGEPVYYTMVPGLRINDARSMNILHRQWNVEDYAQSYAATGNQEYVKYLDLREAFGQTHSVTMLYIVGSDTGGVLKKFREGDLVIEDLGKVRARLAFLQEVAERIGHNNRSLARALLFMLNTPDFSPAQFLRKLEEAGVSDIRRFGYTEDYLRVFENIYNRTMPATSRLRFY